jgi:hypothetical protein
MIPTIDAPSYIDFCRSELMLYKPLCNIPLDIGTSNEEITTNWAQMKNTYTPWHVDHKPPTPLPIAQENAFGDEMKTPHPMDLDEWEILSQLHPTNNIQISDLDMLGHHDFDNNHNWNTTSIPFNLQEISIHS